MGRFSLNFDFQLIQLKQGSSFLLRTVQILTGGINSGPLVRVSKIRRAIRCDGSWDVTVSLPCFLGLSGVLLGDGRTGRLCDHNARPLVFLSADSSKGWGSLRRVENEPVQERDLRTLGEREAKEMRLISVIRFSLGITGLYELG
ncbi:hypothetical protein E2320_020881 [Naja naja]|nr:hypothetical protein E2320_020881 [Naja naja]